LYGRTEVVMPCDKGKMGGKMSGGKNPYGKKTGGKR